MTGRARDMVLEANENGSLSEVIADGGYYGMQTFEQALLKHLRAGLINLDDALAAATNVHDFKLLVQSDGRRGTTMADVEDSSPAASTPRTPASPNRLATPSRTFSGPYSPREPTLHLVK